VDQARVAPGYPVCLSVCLSIYLSLLSGDDVLPHQPGSTWRLLAMRRGGETAEQLLNGRVSYYGSLLPGFV
jgi:hypothetical protein